MLRTVFEQPKRTDQGRLKQVMDTIQEAADHYERSRHGAGEKSDRYFRMLMWTKSLSVTFDELEQSVYCSELFAERVTHQFVEEMDEAERDDYRRHLYFYKNGFIRIFSVLDKLGSFMNEEYSLHTEQMKERYSYFTVLRRMRQTHQHQELLHRLNDIKDRYRDAMQDLRSMRNHEVHAINAEWMDDQGRIRRGTGSKREQIEDLEQNGKVLRDGYDMVLESLHTVFTYAKKLR